MWKSYYETVTDVPADRLFKVITDINNWNKWEHGLDFAKIDGPAEKGKSFMLKPKGGPKVRMTIDESKPYIFRDTAHLFLAKMRCTHEYIPSGDKTIIRFTIEIWGILGFFWRKIVGENQIKEADAQAIAFINYARISS